MTQRLNAWWRTFIEARDAGIDARLAVIKALLKQESRPQRGSEFAYCVREAKIRWGLVALLRFEAVTLRMLRRLQLASLRARVVMVRTETVLLRMLLWPRWPG